MYLIWSAISVTIRYIQQNVPQCMKYKDKQQQIDDELDLMTSKPTGCCKYNSLQWYEIIHWVLYTVGGEAAIVISILFWALLRSLFNYYSFMSHLVNALIAVLDIWVTRLPIRLYHAVYLVMFSAVYIVFTGIYFVAGGGNEFNNATYIYPVLDYEESPDTASGIAIGLALVYVPLIHLFFYINYLLREGVLYIIRAKCCSTFNAEQKCVLEEYEMKLI